MNAESERLKRLHAPTPTREETRFVAEAPPITPERLFRELVMLSCGECNALFPWSAVHVQKNHGPRFCPNCGRRNSEAP